MVYCCFPTSDLFLPVFHIAQLRKVFYYGEDYHQQYLAKPGPSWVWCLEWKEVDSQGSGMTQTPHDKEGQHMSKLKIPGSDSVRCSALLLSAATAGWGIGPVSRYYSDSFQPMQLILGCQKELGRPRWTKYCSTEWPFASGLWTIPSTENQRSPRTADLKLIDWYTAIWRGFLYASLWELVPKGFGVPCSQAARGDGVPKRAIGFCHVSDKWR